MYDYVIVGAGIAGCSVAHFLENENTLLLDKNEDVAMGASGAAGAFMSPLLGKPNKFKDLVTKALTFSVDYYQTHFSSEIINNGVIRIPKNKEDAQKFEGYKDSMDFEYKKEEAGYFFDIGSRVNSYNICHKLSQKCDKKFNYDVKHIEFKEGVWWINEGEIKTKNLILTTGHDVQLVNEAYFNIRAIWGQKIDISTTTCIPVNYHKECSLASSVKSEKNNEYLSAIGATHHRFEIKTSFSKNYLNEENLNKMSEFGYTQSVIDSDTQDLLDKASRIKTLENITVLDVKVGARASSVDYFPMVGQVINSKVTMDMFPHLKNGTHVQDERFSYYENLFVLNGVGGRGFVLSTYLAKNLVDFIKNNKTLDEEIVSNRLFKRWVRKQT